MLTASPHNPTLTCKSGPEGDLPLVSIGLPVYNGERYLSAALEALCAQDYPNLEIVISDNASEDGTAGICRRFAERFPYIKVHRQPRNVGVQKNFAATLDCARGKYFFWAGMDDFWLPGFTRALVQELEAHPEASLAMTAFERVYEDGSVYDVQSFRGKDSPNGQGPFRLLMLVTSPLKYNLFIYGLFRTAFLRTAISSFLEIPAWDRVFMCAVALATPIRCVDRVLHRHALNPVPVQKRYPKESVFLKKGRPYRSLFWNTLRSIYRTILTAEMVPAKHKPLAAAGMLHYAWVIFDNRLRVAIKKTILRIYEFAAPWKNFLKGRLLCLDQRLASPESLTRGQRRRWRAEHLFWASFWYSGKMVNRFLGMVLWKSRKASRRPGAGGLRP